MEEPADITPWLDQLDDTMKEKVQQIQKTRWKPTVLEILRLELLVHFLFIDDSASCLQWHRDSVWGDAGDRGSDPGGELPWSETLGGGVAYEGALNQFLGLQCSAMLVPCCQPCCYSAVFCAVGGLWHGADVRSGFLFGRTVQRSLQRRSPAGGDHRGVRTIDSLPLMTCLFIQHQIPSVISRCIVL